MPRLSLVGRSLTLKVLAVFVALLVGFMVPTIAWASEGEEETTGFLAGLDTLVNPDTTVSVESPEQNYQDKYVPELREVRTEDVEETSVMDGIDSVVKVRWQMISPGGATSNLQGFTQYNGLYNLFTWGNNGTAYGSWFLIAIGFVFLWWGVRKAKNMIIAAWRGGKASV